MNQVFQMLKKDYKEVRGMLAQLEVTFETPVHSPKKKGNLGILGFMMQLCRKKQLS